MRLQVRVVEKRHLVSLLKLPIIMNISVLLIVGWKLKSTRYKQVENTISQASSAFSILVHQRYFATVTLHIQLILKAKAGGLQQAT